MQDGLDCLVGEDRVATNDGYFAHGSIRLHGRGQPHNATNMRLPKHNREIGLDAYKDRATGTR
jgi:hypothetical protein